MGEESKRNDVEQTPDIEPELKSSEAAVNSDANKNSTPAGKSNSPLLPHDSEFERDPRDDESFSDREKDYLRDKPPHHS